jgi:ketosteroid isomerase-like protein
MKNKTTGLLLVISISLMGFQPIEQKSDADEQKVDIVNDEFPEAKKEIMQTLDGIFKSIQDGDADKLISYHAYGPKFTEFRDAAPRFNSAENEEFERGFVGAISAFDYELVDLQINVFGEVAVVTFLNDFRPTIGGDVVQIWGQVTLVFVKTQSEWKITHEHHSALNREES